MPTRIATPSIEARLSWLRLLVILLLIALPALGWIGTLGKLNKEEMAYHKHGLRNASSLAQAYADRLDRLVGVADQITLQIKFVHAWSSGAVNVEQLVRAGLFPPMTMLHVAIADRRGILISGSYQVGSRTDVSDRDYFVHHRRARSDALWIGPPRPGRVSGVPVVQFTRRLNGPDGQFDGVVIVSAELAYFTGFYEPSSLGQDGLLAMVGTDGMVRASSIGSRPQPADAAPLRAVAGLAGEAPGARLMRGALFADRKARFVAWRKLGNYPLFALVGLPEGDVLAPHVEARRLYITQLILVSSMAASALAFMLYRARKLAWQRRGFEAIRQAHGIEGEGGSVGYFLFRPVFDRAGVLVDLLITDCTESGAGYLHADKEKLLGSKLSRAFGGQVPGRVLEMFVQAGAAGSAVFEYEVPPASPFPAAWMRIKIAYRQDAIAAFFNDISEAKEYQQQLVYQANHDELSGLPNRRWLMEFLPAQLESAQTDGALLALLFLDLSGFKVVNDTLGHAAGDELIRQAASRMQSVLRPSDRVVRFGGDEFVAVLPGVQDKIHVQQVAERIMEAFRHPFEAPGIDRAIIGASIGISLFPDNGRDVDSLLQFADAAMYAVKRESKTGYRFFQIDQHLHLQKQFDAQEELLNAIETDQFYLVYQPKVAAASGRLCGMEALVRWRHPVRGTVPPSEFIPRVEESGLIERLGALVIDKACAQLAVWAAQGLPGVPVAVNVSPTQLSQANLVRTLTGALERHALAPCLLQIELTESSMVRRYPEIEAQLAELRRLGIELAIDDFGTGYSSLSQLHRIRPDVLKIDKSFIDDITTGTVFANSIITLAHALKVRVVAEGVETGEQARILRSLGCDEFQGYLFSRPVAAADMAALMRKGFIVEPGDIAA